jgi:acyl-coenzyme A synthetase/AMP-(fatty) acid ligase
MAFVILKSSAASKWANQHTEFEKELKAFAKTKLPGFACPEWVRVVDELPKTGTGKIQKNVLRKALADEVGKEGETKEKAKL